MKKIKTKLFLSIGIISIIFMTYYLTLNIIELWQQLASNYKYL